VKATHQLQGGLLAAVVFLLASPASAEPLNLSNATPRWIEVTFETSPMDQPGQRRSSWGRPLPAMLRPSARRGWLIVAIPPDIVERELIPEQNPVPGSFSPFVWVFDAGSGHVVSADLEGAVHRRVPLGFLRPKVRAEVRFEMATDRVAGFLEPRNFFGQRIHEFCDTAGAASACTLVPPVVFDRKTGYVNAVGLVEAHSKGIATRSFSSLGEARFFERASRGLMAVSAGPYSAESP
jgi:hypothetical protein